jgi:hypothetical protein
MMMMKETKNKLVQAWCKRKGKNTKKIKKNLLGHFSFTIPNYFSTGSDKWKRVEVVNDNFNNNFVFSLSTFNEIQLF